MHEMAIAESIMDIVMDYARRENASHVSTIALRIGAMTGVEEEALRTAFRVITTATIANGARLIISRVPLVVRCQLCDYECQLEEYNFYCPDCDEGIMDIVSGREMQVEYLEVE